MQKRAQMSQIFVYVMTMVIIGLLLLFGYKGIKTLTSTADKGKALEFKANMNNVFAGSSSYGSEDYPSFRMPANTKGICFIDDDATTKPSDDSIIPTLVKDVINSDNVGSRDNVYLLKSDGGLEPFKVDTKISLETGKSILCISTPSGTLGLHLTGKGKSILVAAG